MSVYYLGSFPPPFGGVTVKNDNLFRALEQKTGEPVCKIDFSKIKRKNFRELFLLIKAVTGPRNRYIVGVAGRKYRKYFVLLLSLINRRGMEGSILITMGGLAAGDIVSDQKLCRAASHFKRIYSETPGMVRMLEEAGLPAAYYPNGRFRPTAFVPVFGVSDQPIKALFFSRICINKGADIVLETARRLPGIMFSFYGEIEKGYEDSFLERVRVLDNVTYQGVFRGKGEEVYAELSGYDVLLLPTSHAAEGVPGILVEAKIAGLAEIVSNAAYNSEIVKDGENGIVLKENTSEALQEALACLSSDKELLYKMKKNSFASAEEYYIESYTDSILKDLEEGI